jgi:ABC-type polysaccharide/polyol phosphate transport system ATPase subunit
MAGPTATDAAVVVDRVSKRFLLGEDRPGGSLREALSNSARRVVRRDRARPRDEIWSLRDVSLEVADGDAVGIIGRNGAGKSTLLKILSRIIQPTAGVAWTRGRVAAMLEVGTGFHPELTGRENVYLNGALLGMSRRDLNLRFDDIVSFAGVERFLDTPVKRYSSGMHLRLAFAVAAHLEPDILVVDEVLAVGDAEFQRRCLSRMSEAEREGRTVIFVSHDLEAITRLCREAVWLDAGRVQARGPADDIVADYLASGAQLAARRGFDDDPNRPVAIRSVEVLDRHGRSTTILQREQPFRVAVEYEMRADLPGFDAAVTFTTSRGILVLEETWSDTVVDRPRQVGRYRLEVTVPPVLNVGEYVIGVWFGTDYEAFAEEPMAARLALEGSVKGRPERLVELRLPWSVQSLNGSTPNS